MFNGDIDRSSNVNGGNDWTDVKSTMKVAIVRFGCASTTNNFETNQNKHHQKTFK